MSLTGNNILGGASGQTTGYDIEQSVRFDDGNTVLYHYPDSDYSDGTRWTLSTWIKLEGEKTSNTILLQGQASNTGNDDENQTYLGWWWDGTGYRLFYNVRRSNAFETRITFTPLLADFAAWYHCLFVYNSNESSADDRIKFYLNGTLITDRTTTDSVSSGATSFIMLNGGLTNVHGHWNSSSPRVPGYLADFHWIDGQALTTAAFLETDSDTNQVKPIEYAGTYGNSGFYFKFQDSSNLGDDSSGNGHDFTNHNLVATDVTIDSPTNNFATLNPLIKGTETPVFSEGNLRCVSSGSTRGYFVPATIPVSSGKWYAGFCVTSTDVGFIIGAMPVNLNTGSGYLGGGAGQGSGYYGTNGQAYNYDNGGTQDTTPATAANGDIIGVALDMDDSSGKLYIYRNNTILDTVVSGDSFTNYKLKTVNDYWTFALGNNAA